MRKNKTHFYRVIAHIADGDVEIKPKGNNKFSTLNEAVQARNEHLSLCENIDVYCCTL